MIASGALALALVVSLILLINGGAEDAGEETVDQTPTTGDAATSISGGVTSGTTADGSTSDSPPVDLLAVVVDNAPAARPQVGLGESPVLIEYPVEGGLTRFTALVPSGSAGLIGPVRSLRPVNADLLPVFSSAVATSGGQAFVLQDVAAAGLTTVVPGLAPGFVSLGRPQPHDTFLDLEMLADLFVVEASVPGLPSGDSLPLMRTVATEVDLPFGGVGFSYEPGVGYVRRQDGEPFEVLDSAGAESKALSHDTLVILSVAERSAGYTDSNGVPVSTFDVIGGGDLRVLHDGELLVGTWSRSAMVDGYEFRDDIGEPFGLPEGSVYLALVPRDAQVVTR